MTTCICDNCGWKGDSPQTFNGSWADWIECQDPNSPVILPEGDCPECDCPAYREDAAAALQQAKAAPALLDALAVC